MVRDPQSLDVNIHFLDWQTDRLLDGVFYPIHQAVRHFRDAGSIFDHDIQVDRYLIVVEVYLYSTSEMGAWKHVRDTVAEIAWRHPHNTVGFQHGLARDARNRGGRYLDRPQDIAFTHRTSSSRLAETAGRDTTAAMIQSGNSVGMEQTSGPGTMPTHAIITECLKGRQCENREASLQSGLLDPEADAIAKVPRNRFVAEDPLNLVAVPIQPELLFTQSPF